MHADACAAQVLDQQQLPWSDEEGLPVHACAWCPSGKHAAISLSSGQAAGTILVVDTTLQLLHQVQLPTKAARADSLAFDPSGAVLAYVSCQQLCWDTLPGRPGAASTAALRQLAALRQQAGTLPLKQVSWCMHGACMVLGKQTIFVHPSAPARTSHPVLVIERVYDQLAPCLHPTGKQVLKSLLKQSSGEGGSGAPARRQKSSWFGAGSNPIALSYHPTGQAWAVLFNQAEHAHVVVCSSNSMMLQRVCLGRAAEQVLAKSTQRLAWSASGDALRIILTNDKAVALTWGGAVTNYSWAVWRVRLALAEAVSGRDAFWAVCRALAFGCTWWVMNTLLQWMCAWFWSWSWSQ